MIRECISMALTSIRSNKMRSFLTMLGIIIGIASVIAITTIGASARALMSKELGAFGKNRVMIFPSQQTWEGKDEDISRSRFTQEDIEKLKEAFPQTAAYITPLGAASKAEIKAGSNKVEVSVTGIEKNYEKHQPKKMIYGRMVTPAEIRDKRKVIVVHESVGKKLYNNANIVGKVLEVPMSGQSVDMLVVGVYATEKSLFSGLTGNSAPEAYVPFSLINNSSVASGVLDLFVNPIPDEKTAVDQMMTFLTRVKGLAPKSYTYESVAQQTSMIDNLLGTLAAAIGAIAAISLLVGGIGIMNIMLVSVTERTKEIGIRKSLGARRRDILLQFLMESMILAILGGLIGTSLGIGIGFIGSKIAKVHLVTDPMMILLAIGFSAFVGVFFGIYPANKAAKLDPIDALRYE